MDADIFPHSLNTESFNPPFYIINASGCDCIGFSLMLSLLSKRKHLDSLRVSPQAVAYILYVRSLPLGRAVFRPGLPRQLPRKA